MRVHLVADPYPPYQFEEGGRVKGLDQETIAEAFAVHEVEVHTSLLPWGQCLERMDDRTADGIFQIVPTPERMRRYLFSDQLREERTVLFGRTGAHPLPEGADLQVRLRGRTLGVLRGYRYDAAIEALPFSVKGEFETQEALLRALADARVDLVLMDIGVAAHLVKTLGLYRIEQVPGHEIRRSLHVAFQQARGRLVELFNAGLQDVKRQELDRQIAGRYGAGI